MKKIVFLLFVIFPLLPHMAVSHAGIDAYEFKDPVQENRFQDFAKTMRCPKCQNQNLADSNSPIAADLRDVLYKMVTSGKTDTEIVQFMVERYGDFVLYDPKLSPKTLVLWIGPALFLTLGLIVVFVLARKTKASRLAGQNVANAANQLTDEEQKRLQQLLVESDK